MSRLDARLRAVAHLLAFVAGAVDALGYLMLGGFFVSFMSGNSTRLGVAIGTGQWTQATMAGALITLFVIGVGCGSVAGERAGRWRVPLLLALEAALLLAAAALPLAGWPRPGISVMVLAMGVSNTVFARNGVVAFGVTYMTGALVRVGEGLGAAALGRKGNGWHFSAMSWLSLVAGGAVGASLHDGYGVNAFWLLGAVVAALAVLLAGWPEAAALGEGREQG